MLPFGYHNCSASAVVNDHLQTWCISCRVLVVASLPSHPPAWSWAWPGPEDGARQRNLPGGEGGSVAAALLQPHRTSPPAWLLAVLVFFPPGGTQNCQYWLPATLGLPPC